jgi:glycerol-3-phosphate acyltransferase PlsY
MHPAIALGVAYLAGSIPSAFLAGRMIKGVDLRTIGSGNLGATNVYRNLGATAAVVVLLMDALKGALPVLLLPGLVDPRFLTVANAAEWWGLAFGIAAIAGHSRSVFLLWKGGGKGVATGAGVFTALAPVAQGIAVIVFILTLWRSRYVSLASILGALTLPVAIALTAGVGSPLFGVSCIVVAFVVWSHRANIARLRQGIEPRIRGHAVEGSQ